MAAQVVDVHTGSREHMVASQYPLVSWKSVIAGLLVALVCYMALMSLGAAVGGTSIQNMLQKGGDGGDLARGAGIWAGLALIISLAVGSYFAARVSTFITGRIGAAQGLVIASLFFVIAMFGAGSSVKAISSGLGSAIGTISGGADEVASSPVVQNTLQRAFGDRTLKSDPDIVAQQLAIRLLRGDDEGFRNYLAYQTGMTRNEVDQRLVQIQQDISNGTRNAALSAAKAVTTAGWSVFATLVLGILFSAFGGALGSRANYVKPLAEDTVTPQMIPSPVV